MIKLFSRDDVAIRRRNKIEAICVKSRQETASSVQGRMPTVRSGRRDKVGRSFYIQLSVVSTSSLWCNCEIRLCFSIWSFLSCMEPGGLKSSTSCLPMQKLCYQKRLKCMSNDRSPIWRHLVITVNSKGSSSTVTLNLSVI